MKEGHLVNCTGPSSRALGTAVCNAALSVNVRPFVTTTLCSADNNIKSMCYSVFAEIKLYVLFSIIRTRASWTIAMFGPKLLMWRKQSKRNNSDHQLHLESSSQIKTESHSWRTETHEFTAKKSLSYLICWLVFQHKRNPGQQNQTYGYIFWNWDFYIIWKLNE